MTDPGLNKSATVVLNAAGSGQCVLGPSDRGNKPHWSVDALLWGNNNPARVGKSPIPRVQIFLDQTDPSGLQAQSYDGSFGSASGALSLTRPSNLIAVWTGGQAGDSMFLSVTGTAS